MLLFLVPYAIAACVFFLLTWVVSRKCHGPIKALWRSIGVSIVFAPTHTSGGNGQMWSVELYDIILSFLGDDPIYAKVAIWHALLCSIMLWPLFWFIERWIKRG
jgi:hypothetical protein